MGRIYHRALAASESKQGGIVVTWVRVPQYESSIYYIDTNLNTFQVALEYDGTITLSYLTLTTSDGVCVCACVRHQSSNRLVMSDGVSRQSTSQDRSSCSRPLKDAPSSPCRGYRRPRGIVRVGIAAARPRHAVAREPVDGREGSFGVDRHHRV